MRVIEWQRGQKITVPGVYANVSMAAYHSQDLFDGPSISSSGLRRVLEINKGSPAHFYAEWSGNPKRVEREESKALAFGRLAHHLLLGQQAFSKHFATRPKDYDSYKTAAARQWRDDVIKRGLTPVTPEEVESVRGMQNALRQNPMVYTEELNRFRRVVMRSGMLTGMIELSMFWKDKETGLWIKARPDAMPTTSADYADFKTTTSVQHNDLIKTISDYAYHQQAALVAEGSRLVAEIEMQSFSFIFAEKKPPYCVRVVHLKDEDIALGHRQNHSAMRLIARCLKDNRWPGPGDTHVSSIDLSGRYREAAQALIADEKHGAR